MMRMDMNGISPTIYGFMLVYSTFLYFSWLLNICEHLLWSCQSKWKASRMSDICSSADGEALVDTCSITMEDFEPMDVANLLWSFARLDLGLVASTIKIPWGSSGRGMIHKNERTVHRFENAMISTSGFRMILDTWDDQTDLFFSGLPSGKLEQRTGKSPLLIGRSTISMAIFNSKVYRITRIAIHYH